MCSFKLSNPGLPAELWDAFDSDDDTDGPIEDEHHAILIAQAICMPESSFRICSRAIAPLSANFLTSLSAIG